MRWGWSKLPRANAKYVNCYNFWWDCPILIYLVCLDSQWRTTSYINVYVSHKIISGIRNGTILQKWGGVLKYSAPVISNRRKKFEYENRFENKVLENNLSPREKHSDTKWSVGVKTPHQPLCEIYRLLILLMLWSDLNVFRKYWFRGCTLKVKVFRTILVWWEKQWNHKWSVEVQSPLPPIRNM